MDDFVVVEILIKSGSHFCWNLFVGTDLIESESHLSCKLSSIKGRVAKKQKAL